MSTCATCAVVLSGEPVRCSLCTSVLYCSNVCRANDFSRHVSECCGEVDAYLENKHSACELSPCTPDCVNNVFRALTPLRWLLSNGAKTASQLAKLFCDSICVGDLPTCFLILKHLNFDVNVATATGVTPLLVVCERQSMQLLDHMLVNSELDINAIVPLHNVCCFYYACAEGLTDVVNTLLSRDDVDINWIRPEHGSTAMHAAAMNGHHLIVRRLLLDSRLNVFADVHSKCDTAIFVACENGDHLVVREILSSDYDINSTCDPNVLRVSDGCSALFIACQGNHSNVVRQLISHQRLNTINVPLRSGPMTGWVPLLVAAYCGSVDSVCALLQSKSLCCHVVVDCKTIWGWTREKCESMVLAFLNDRVCDQGRCHVRDVIRSCLYEL